MTLYYIDCCLAHNESYCKIKFNEILSFEISIAAFILTCNFRAQTHHSMKLICKKNSKQKIIFRKNNFCTSTTLNAFKHVHA